MIFFSYAIQKTYIVFNITKIVKTYLFSSFIMENCEKVSLYAVNAVQGLFSDAAVEKPTVMLQDSPYTVCWGNICTIFV